MILVSYWKVNRNQLLIQKMYSIKQQIILLGLYYKKYLKL